MAQIGPQVPHGIQIDQTTDSLAALASQYGMPAAQLPLRPGMSPCRFYLRTGECKYADTCKFDHPVDRQAHLGPPLQQPGQPTCQHYMRTGNCMFGSTCKFDHPLDREAQAAVSGQVGMAAGAGGFPVRPGMSDCRFYMQNGTCRFGATCKFNHPPSRNGGMDMGMGMDPMMMQANGGHGGQQQWQGQETSAVTGILLSHQRAAAQSYLENPAAAAYGAYQDPHAANGNAGYEKRDREGGAAVDPYKRQRVGEAGQQGASHQKPAAAMYSQQQQQQVAHQQPQQAQQQQQQQQPSYDYGAPLYQQGEQRYEPQQQQQMQQAYAPQAAWGGAPPQGREPHWGQPQHNQPMVMQPRRMMMPPQHDMRHPHPHHPHHPHQRFGGGGPAIMGPGAQQPPLRPGAPNCRHFMKTRMCGFGMSCRFNHPLPEREGQPDCSFYMKTGKCKFGESCKFNHPAGVVGELNKGSAAGGHAGAPFPLRPGQPPCKFYMKTGSCSYGPTCKYDHPALAAQPEVTAGAAATNGDATAAAQVAGAQTSAASQPVGEPVVAVSA